VVGLVAFGRYQHRMLTVAQLRAVGWDDSAVSKRVDRDELYPVFFQVYSLAPPPYADKGSGWPQP
jgi:hypothetical protein